MNREKLIELREYLSAFPNEVHMSTWIDVTECGTVACAAGHAVLLDGVAPPEGITPSRVNPYARFAWVIDTYTKTSRWATPETEQHISDEVSPFMYAMRVLGLSKWDAENLFLHSKNVTDAVRVLDSLIEKATHEPESAR